MQHGFALLLLLLSSSLALSFVMLSLLQHDSHLGEQQQIDVVYLWVNGSDPDHARGLFVLFVHQFYVRLEELEERERCVCA